jgi:hypothetical protein
MLFAEYGFESMSAFAIEHLKYSEGSAHRRISAARLLKEVPEVETSIIDGSLNLTTLSMAHCFFRSEQKEEGKIYQPQQKRELLETLKNKSRLQVERKFAEITPQRAKPDQVRAITPTTTELRITVGNEFLDQIEQLKKLLAHQIPGASTQDVLKYLVQEKLEKIDPARQAPKKLTKPPNSIPPAGKYIPAQLEREVRADAHHRCQFTDSKTLRRCNSTYATEIDHITPKALGGKTEKSNLRLLCRTHNAYEAVRKLGVPLMSHYLPKLRA